MELIFTKGAGKLDWLDIDRGDGLAERIDCPKQRIIPHDMVHYAVETMLAARGFLTRVRDGEAASFGMAAATESDAVERLVEVMQGEAWSGEADSAAVIDLYRVTCAARACPMLDVASADINAIRDRMAELDTEWRAVPVNGTMRLTFKL